MPHQIQAALISDEIVDQVVDIGKNVAPLEACGLILPDGSVVQLPNVSPEPLTSYVVDVDSLVDEFYKFAESVVLPVSDLEPRWFTIWHTHPGGVVGPSRADMRQKVDGFRYLVVTLPGGEASQF